MSILTLLLVARFYDSSLPVPTIEYATIGHSDTIYGVPPLSHPVFVTDTPPTEVAETSSFFVLGSTTSSILFFVLSVLSIFSIMRWREWRDRKKTETSKKKEVMQKSSIEIDAVARKFQKRLPENRIIRDRMAGTTPRNRSKPLDSIVSNPFTAVQRQSALSKILIVESNREFRTSLTNLLHRFYSTLESTDLDEALRIARIARPSLIILSLVASKQECMAFCRKLKSDSSLWHIPVLLLLPKKSNGETAHLMKATDDWLKIPVQSAELLVAVENMVDVRRYLKQGGLQRPVFSSDDSTTQISDSMFLEAVHTVVENNLSNSLFGLETLATEVNVSVRQLHGQIRKLTRLSPAGFIRTKRLKAAADLLSADEMDVSSVAEQVGFHSYDHFVRVFRQAFGVVPEEYNKGM